MNIHPLFILLLGLFKALFFVFLVWQVARKIKHYAIIDVFWSSLIAYLGLYYYVLTPIYGARQLILTLLVMIWGLRLSLHIFSRMKQHKQEDARYAKLVSDWGDQHERKMLRFYAIQGASAFVFSIPFFVVCLDAQVAPHFLHWIGLMIGFMAILGEALSDFQLHRFKSNPKSQGKVCDQGLWAYSRHPNYFFEWLFWVSVAVYAISSPWGWLGLFAAAFMFHALHNVTGVPMSEEQSLKSRGDLYRQYQKKTSKFFPLPPKSL